MSGSRVRRGTGSSKQGTFYYFGDTALNADVFEFTNAAVVARKLYWSVTVNIREDALHVCLSHIVPDLGFIQ